MPLNPAFAPIFLTLTAFGWLQLHGPAATKGLEDLRPACAALENPYRVVYVSWGGKTVNGMLCVLNTFFATLLAQPDGKDLTAYFLATFGPIFVLVPLLEATRPGRSILLALPNLFGMAAQLLGAGVAIPAYFLLFALGRADTSFGSQEGVERALVSTFVGFGIPSLRIISNQSPSALAVFQIFPLFAMGAGSLWGSLRRASRATGTQRGAYMLAQTGFTLIAALSGYAHYKYFVPRFLDAPMGAELVEFLKPQYSLPFSGSTGGPRAAPDLNEAVLDFIKWDFVCTAAAIVIGSIFTLNNGLDLAAFVLASVVAGPGAGCALLFALRESRIEEWRLAVENAKKE
ncbi:hypothetical protein EXIGLDRAFT_837318 [Exidia glandulosa HHB12029]|uniref:Uncharacterized protein n=1 Tax=Exidia glandulosa HHB12029 TaxID=1314781 RepID=A0A166AEQ8_EXIGL|nr:hypothetical protein EXIGLDRAFT_837318 [Exidia glandulosa HHB12029]